MTLRTPAKPQFNKWSLVQQRSQAYDVTNWKDILTLLKLPLKTLHCLSHYISYSKAAQNWRRLKPRTEAGLIVSMT